MRAHREWNSWIIDACLDQAVLVAELCCELQLLGSLLQLLGSQVASCSTEAASVSNHLPPSPLPHLQASCGCSRSSAAPPSAPSPTTCPLPTSSSAGELRLFPLECRATVGTVSNHLQRMTNLGKAGENRKRGRRPKVDYLLCPTPPSPPAPAALPSCDLPGSVVCSWRRNFPPPCLLSPSSDPLPAGPPVQVRGIAMNPVDHPHGGRADGGRPSCSPWGVYTKGKRTRSRNSATNKYILLRKGGQPIGKFVNAKKTKAREAARGGGHRSGKAAAAPKA